MTKFRIIEQSFKIKIQEKSFWTLWKWNTCSKWCGSLGNEDYVYSSIKEAQSAIEKFRNGGEDPILIIKEYL